MITVDDLLEPVKTYNSQIKEAHKKNASDFFDDLVKKSNINVEENRNTVAEYKKAKEKAEKLKRDTNKVKSLKTFLVVLIVLLFVVAFIGFIVVFTNTEKINVVAIIVAILSLAGAVSLICFNKIKINVLIREKSKLLNDAETKCQELKTKAYQQLGPLNKLYDWNIPAKLVTATLPLIELDQFFDIKKCQMLVDNFGFKERNDENISTLFVQSGSILGNPFVVEENYVQTMENKVYTGSIVISWTTTERVNGRVQTVTHTQTLTASVSRPAPKYYLDTWLIYANEAAPKLSFSRTPSKANTMNDNQIEKYVKSFDKELDKRVRKDIDPSDGSQFTKLANTKFEALFHALDRNNEVEFRLLFTPLAQKNMVDLITSKQPYGDDFIFRKKQKLNYIKSKHSQGKDISGNPNVFIDYDVDNAKEKFINYNTEYIKNLFFDLAPLLSIPLYQHTKTKEYIYKDNYASNFCNYEHEVLANSFDKKMLQHPESDTDLILKTKVIGKDNDKDFVQVTANSFKAEERIEYVARMGGDGHLHHIPVRYYEYIPVSQTNNITMQHYNASRQEFNEAKINNNLSSIVSQNANSNAIIYQRGLLAYLLTK